MKIDITEGSTEARVIDRLGFRAKHYVRVNKGVWVGDDGLWASRELALRIESVADRADALIHTRSKLEANFVRAFGDGQ